MKYYFVEATKNKRHILVAENVEHLKNILDNAKQKYISYYELEPNTFKDGGFLISDK